MSEPSNVRVIEHFDLFSVSFVHHPWHGPWSYDDDVCRGCGVGLEVTFGFDPTVSVEGHVRPSALWSQSYYPWLDNGWVVCVCQAEFASERGGRTAVDKHTEHVEKEHQ